MKINNLNIKLSVLFITFCIQTTEFKIGFVKVSEIALLLATPFLFRKALDKHFYYFMFFFLAEMIVSFFITSTHVFDTPSRSLLKSPYIITVGRTLEIVASLALAIITYKVVKYNQGKWKDIVNYLVNWNFCIALAFVFVYVLVVIKIVPIDSSVVVYAENRLRGFYVEGGPFGLMLGFIYILTTFQKKTLRRTVIRIVLVFIIYFLAKSKAGTMMIVLWIAIQNFNYIREKVRPLIYPIAIVSAVAFYFIFTKVSVQYIYEIEKIRNTVHVRPGDVNLVMGRISGVFIAPAMISQHPVLGIGIGNYPLIRNNIEYRGFFPLPPKEVRDMDAHGLGGIMDIWVDMGLVGLIIFGLINYSIYLGLGTINKGRILLISFLGLFLFGVQIYFLYPWVLLGIILAYKNGYIDEISS